MIATGTPAGPYAIIDPLGAGGPPPLAAAREPRRGLADGRR
jgi:hypothetical protein